MIRNLALTFLLASLVGCAGTDFIRPDSADLTVGGSTYSQVIAKMGSPRHTGELLTNGEKVKTITYSYASTGGDPAEPGVIPARAMVFYFFQDRLVGQEFLSSFKSDNTNFDDTRVATFKKGTTTRSDVIHALGKPTGTFVSPMVKDGSGETFGYDYQATSGSAFTGLKSFRKMLRIAFDGNDRVLDVSYSSSGAK